MKDEFYSLCFNLFIRNKPGNSAEGRYRGWLCLWDRTTALFINAAWPRRPTEHSTALFTREQVIGLCSLICPGFHYYLKHSWRSWWINLVNFDVALSPMEACTGGNPMYLWEQNETCSQTLVLEYKPPIFVSSTGKCISTRRTVTWGTWDTGTCPL